jgi:hypothetical protein
LRAVSKRGRRWGGLALRGLVAGRRLCLTYSGDGKGRTELIEYL